MKRLYSAVFFVALSLFAQDPSAPTPAKTKGRVEGKVINSANGEPVRKVTVILGTRKGAQGTSYVVESNASGRFAIDSVEPGEYTISADHQGFMVKPPGALGIPMPPLKVESGQPVPELTITLLPLGVITGRVMDEDGDPMRGTEVAAMQYSYVAGKRQLRTVNQVSADDKGEFRLYGLRPGTFYVQALRRDFQMSFGQPGDQIRGTRPASGPAPTYYPSSTDVARAVPVEVTAGALLRGIDIHLRRAPAYAVRGKFPPDDSRQNPGGYRVQLFAREGSGSNFGMRRTNDAFEIPGVLPGSYMLVGMRMDGDKRTYAYQPVEMADGDVDVGTLTFSPGSDVSGVIRIEGGAQRPPDLRVSLQPERPSIFGLPNAEVKPDGSFVLHDVAPTVYTVNLGAVPGAYLKSIQTGDHTLQDHRLDVTQGSGQLTVVLASDVAQVEGSVKKADGGEPAVRARVTLLPEGDQSVRQDLYRYAFSDEKGEYKIKSVPPGEYKIFAWEEVQAGAPQDPEFRKPFEKRGVTLKIPSNGHVTADLTVISLADMQQPKP